MQLTPRRNRGPLAVKKVPIAKKAPSRFGICIEHLAACGSNVDMPLGYLFPNSMGRVVGHGTMSCYMENRGLQAQPHGLRSNLRDWLAETSNLSHAAAESCIAHNVDNQNVRSYRRTDFLEQREVVMARWAWHVTGKGSEVVQLVREA